MNKSDQHVYCKTKIIYKPLWQKINVQDAHYLVGAIQAKNKWTYGT